FKNDRQPRKERSASATQTAIANSRPAGVYHVQPQGQSAGAPAAPVQQQVKGGGQDELDVPAFMRKRTEVN
ncbi:MAG TPA: hypothetical protein VEW69_13155, partial [Alphaproteobacteria bacterium]|nr:hypothetical protein [Alphaproteobacteria bacterium]